MALKDLKAGQILQSTAFPCVKAVVAEELLPGFYTWYLAKPDRLGGFVKFGSARFSEIDSQSWTEA
jgi:hypothetical protein